MIKRDLLDKQTQLSMDETKKAEKKSSFEEAEKASAAVRRRCSIPVQVAETELSSQPFEIRGADVNYDLHQASAAVRNEPSFSVQVSETELSSQPFLERESDSTHLQSEKSEHLSIPVQETRTRRQDDSASPFEEDKLMKYSPIPVSLPPTDECQLCERKFRGNFLQYNMKYCGDCSRFRDFGSCETKDYKRPSGPPITTF